MEKRWHREMNGKELTWGSLANELVLFGSVFQMNFPRRNCGNLKISLNDKSPISFSEKKKLKAFVPFTSIVDLEQLFMQLLQRKWGFHWYDGKFCIVWNCMQIRIFCSFCLSIVLRFGWERAIFSVWVS
jgi:hypothetical protein